MDATELRHRIAALVPVVFRPEARGGYRAEAPALPGCEAWGDDMDEARTNIRDAVEDWLVEADRRATGLRP